MKKTQTPSDTFEQEVAKLRALASELQAGLENVAERLPPAAGDIALNYRVRATIQARSRRRAVFPDLDFAEPSWDTLLALFQADLDGTSLSTTAAVVAAGVPTTTALRWIAVLQEQGMIVREADRVDPRRVLIKLSEGARAAMMVYFDGVEVTEAVAEPVRPESVTAHADHRLA